MSKMVSALVLLGFVAVGHVVQAQSNSASTPSPMPPAMTPAERPGSMDAATKGSIKVPKVTILEPQDGATVESEVTVKFQIDGKAIGELGNKASSSHAHLIVDGIAVKSGETIPTDDKHLHLGKDQTEVKVKLAKGEHKLTVQIADAQHKSFGEMLSHTITVKVK